MAEAAMVAVVTGTADQARATAEVAMAAAAMGEAAAGTAMVGTAAVAMAAATMAMVGTAAVAMAAVEVAMVMEVPGKQRVVEVTVEAAMAAVALAAGNQSVPCSWRCSAHRSPAIGTERWCHHSEPCTRPRSRSLR